MIIGIRYILTGFAMLFVWREVELATFAVLCLLTISNEAGIAIQKRMWKAQMEQAQMIAATAVVVQRMRERRDD